MQVTLINFTSDAETLLLFTKNTRLTMSPASLEEIRAWPQGRKVAELQYMATTIKSSWEFLDVVFLVEGITRACAQQMTRTRAASYAMQSQRVTDARTIPIRNTVSSDAASLHAAFDLAAESARAAYIALVDAGVPLEDARGILPMNVECNLVAKYNLRSFTDLIKTRKSLRAQGEYGAVAREMERLVLEVWPWAEPFFRSESESALRMLEQAAQEIGIKTGQGPGWTIAKAIDLLRKETAP